MTTRRNRIFLGLSVLALGCGGSVAGADGSNGGGGNGASTSAGGGGSGGSDPRPDAGPAGGSGGSVVQTCTPGSAGCGPIVHEWGTYTSVHATDGHALGGVHHVDEALPAWVHRREFTPQSYNFEQLPEEPHEQLETPVLYFHSPTAMDVKVVVDFPEGIVGEWFPEAETFAPAHGSMTSLGGGSMTWNVNVDPSIEPSSFLSVSPDEIWAPSRNVASTPVRTLTPTGTLETEQFIFYRGLAKFDPSFQTKVSPDGAITLVNPSSETLSAVFVLRRSGESGSFEALGALGAGESKVTSFPTPNLSLDAFVEAARNGLHAELVKTGLYDDEAQAMVDTWTRSWFKNEGTRVLYLAPRVWTDKWLPTTITPPPAELVRTLVGRVELLSNEDEQAVQKQLAAAAQTGVMPPLESLGRFAEPRLARAIEQIGDPQTLDLAKQMKEMAHNQP